MKGIIDESGNLYIERGGKIGLKLQGCPYQEEEGSCGDWCPLFGEPEVSKWMGSPDPDKKGRAADIRHWNLKICKITIFFEELTDERRQMY